MSGADQGAGQRTRTRGFLFADLRGYTEFVERRGAVAAAEMLDVYRALVRATVPRHDGAEIKTEGDSFYLVFPSVSSAVLCGLDIVEAAAQTTTQQAPLQVGVGIHAGETVESADGFVGSAVNIAARVCAQAAPNEVVVTDTVRALTRSLLPIRVIPRGHRALKGIAEPIALYTVERAPGGVYAVERPRRRPIGRRRAIAIGAAAFVIAGGVATAIAMGALRGDGAVNAVSLAELNPGGREPIPGGTYRSAAFRPQVTFRLPDQTWQFEGESEGLISLFASSGTVGNQLAIMRVDATYQNPSCGIMTDPAGAQTAAQVPLPIGSTDALYSFLSRHEDIEITRELPAQYAEIVGQQLDVVGTGGLDCFDDGSAQAILFPIGETAFFMGRGASYRLILLPNGVVGQVIVILLRAEGDQMAAFAALADPMLRSLNVASDWPSR